MSKPLSKTAEALRRYMRGAGDSLSCEIIDGAPVWTLTKAGLACRRRDVNALAEAGAIVAYGTQIDPAAPPACYVLAKKAEGAGTACGAKSLTECTARGFSIDCAPASLTESVRAGRQAVEWHGARP